MPVMFQNVQHLVSNSEECARACTEGEAHRRVYTEGGDVVIPGTEYQHCTGKHTFRKMYFQSREWDKIISQNA